MDIWRGNILNINVIEKSKFYSYISIFRNSFIYILSKKHFLKSGNQHYNMLVFGELKVTSESIISEKNINIYDSLIQLHVFLYQSNSYPTYSYE